MSPSTLLQPAQSTQATSRPLSGCAVETLVGGRSQCEPEWARLFEQSADARVHHHPDYVPTILPELQGLAWTIRYRTGSTSQSMAILVPKRVKLGRHPLLGTAYRVWGARLAGFGLLGSQTDEAVGTIVQTLADEVCRRSIPVVEFEEIDEDSSLWRHLQALQSRGFRFVPSTDFEPHHVITLPGSVDEYWARFRSKRRNTLRKKRERLGNYRVQRFTSRDEVDCLLAAAAAISQHSWQSCQFGLRITGDDRERRYYDFLARHGALRAYVLFRQAQPVAFGLGHQWSGVFHYDEAAFDRRFADRAPGGVLLQEIIDDLLSWNRPDVLDFGLGDAVYKQFFGDRQTRSATIHMLAPGLVGWWRATALRLQQSTIHSARLVTDRVGLAALLRRRLRDRAVTR